MWRLLFVFLIFFLPFIQSQVCDNYFVSLTSSWEDEFNWSLGRDPKVGDVAYVPPSTVVQLALGSSTPGGSGLVEGMARSIRLGLGSKIVMSGSRLALPYIPPSQVSLQDVSVKFPSNYDAIVLWSACPAERVLEYRVYRDNALVDTIPQTSGSSSSRMSWPLSSLALDTPTNLVFWVVLVDGTYSTSSNLVVSVVSYSNGSVCFGSYEGSLCQMMNPVTTTLASPSSSPVTTPTTTTTTSSSLTSTLTTTTTTSTTTTSATTTTTTTTTIPTTTTTTVITATLSSSTTKATTTVKTTTKATTTKRTTTNSAASCNPNPCHNKGNCSIPAETGVPTCLCPSKYIGELCDTLADKSSASGGSSASSVPIIAGAVGGIFFLLLVLVIIFLIIRKRRKESRQPVGFDPSSATRRSVLGGNPTPGLLFNNPSFVQSFSTDYEEVDGEKKDGEVLYEIPTEDGNTYEMPAAQRVYEIPTDENFYDSIGDGQPRRATVVVRPDTYKSLTLDRSAYAPVRRDTLYQEAFPGGRPLKQNEYDTADAAKKMSLESFYDLASKGPTYVSATNTNKGPIYDSADHDKKKGAIYDQASPSSKGAIYDLAFSSNDNQPGMSRHTEAPLYDSALPGTVSERSETVGSPNRNSKPTFDLGREDSYDGFGNEDEEVET